jgi:hypothetical protein
VNATSPPVDQGASLPAAYAPFLPVLERLSEPLQQVLEGQFLQFERQFDAVDRLRFAPLGEFEGIGGLTMRGDILQILQSELLLRTHAPLEFLRRLAEHEILYLEKRYADPGARNIYRVLLSIGPGMLGHGRLVALAAIFFLARVARERGAAFHWCVLPQADGVVWFDEVSVNNVKRFMRAVSYREMTIEDAAEARKAWDERMPTIRGEIAPDCLDWTVGARVDRSAASNALTFAVDPPRTGEPRTSHVVLRQSGYERSRASIVFPDDRVCASAITNPFRPFKPEPTGTPDSEPIPPLVGWEPEYLAIHRGAIKLVRTAAGLLILIPASTDSGWRSWFVPLPSGVTLAGVQVAQDLLWILVHDGRSSFETLRYAMIRPGHRGPAELLARREKSVPSAQLFRKRSIHAIPPLILHGSAAEFHAHSGAAFRLGWQMDAGSTAVNLIPPSPKVKGPMLLLATGVHRIRHIERDGSSRAEVVKGVNSRVDEFALPAESIGRLHGLIYSTNSRSLAYSIGPGVWQIAHRPGFEPEDNTTFTLQRHERLLAAKAGSKGVSLRIWSDARYGGDGRVRSERRDGHQVIARQAPLDLGEDALAIVKVEAADDGLWAIATGSDGFPATLIQYRYHKRQSRYDCVRHAIDDLCADALVLDLDLHHD